MKAVGYRRQMSVSAIEPDEQKLRCEWIAAERDQSEQPNLASNYVKLGKLKSKYNANNLILCLTFGQSNKQKTT